MKKILTRLSLIISVGFLTSCSLSQTEVAQQTDGSSQETKTTKKEEVPMNFTAGSLLKAVTTDNITEVEAILASPDYNLNETDAEGNTPLIIATHENKIEIAKKLIDAGSDVNQQNNIQDSAYLYAGAQGRTEILAYIMAHAEPNQAVYNRFGGNTLIPAAEKGHLENVKLLLTDEQVDKDHQNNYGYTALLEAVALTDGSEVFQEIVKVLVENGVDQSLRDNSGRNALDYAKEKGYREIEALLTK